MFTIKRSTWKSVKYRAHSNDFEHILWPQRWPKEKLKEEKADYVARGLPDVYAQEFLNIPIDESTAYFKKADFLPMRDEDFKLTKNIYITVDLAISQKEKADYSVFLVAGVDQDKRIHVIDIIRDRLDGRDIVNTLLRLQQSYKPLAIGIEESQISKSIGPFLNEAMVASNTYIQLYPLKHMSVDKPTRAKSMQARMRAKGCKFNKGAEWYQAFEDECTRFPRDKHDDQVDAFAYLGLMVDKLIEAPTPKEEELEAYEEFKQQFEGHESGRNLFTGY